MHIVQAPNTVLSQVAKPVKKITPEIVRVIEDMKQTLLQTTDPKGIGLAAPQVGLSLQLFLIKEEDTAPFSVFINPHVTLLELRSKSPAQRDELSTESKTQKKKKERLEGCLSLKDIWGSVKRAPRVKVIYTTVNNEIRTEHFRGFFATIIQHEYDHLQGILFPKRTLEQNGKLYKTHKDEKGEEVFDEIKL